MIRGDINAASVLALGAPTTSTQRTLKFEAWEENSDPISVIGRGDHGKPQLQLILTTHQLSLEARMIPNDPSSIPWNGESDGGKTGSPSLTLPTFTGKHRDRGVG